MQSIVSYHCLHTSEATLWSVNSNIIYQISRGISRGRIAVCSSTLSAELIFNLSKRNKQNLKLLQTATVVTSWNRWVFDSKFCSENVYWVLRFLTSSIKEDRGTEKNYSTSHNKWNVIIILFVLWVHLVLLWYGSLQTLSCCRHLIK